MQRHSFGHYGLDFICHHAALPFAKYVIFVNADP
jgi:hypothetical protein